MISIYNRKVLSVCLSRKMITLPNGLKSSSLVVAFFFLNIVTRNILYELHLPAKKIFTFDFLKKYFAKNRGKKGKSTEKVVFHGFSSFQVGFSYFSWFQVGF